MEPAIDVTEDLFDDEEVFGTIDQGRIYHVKTIKTDFKKLLEDKSADVTITVKLASGWLTRVKQFKAHKLILAARSKFFEALFFGNFKEGSRNEVEITGVDPDTFGQILQWIYTATITVSEEHIRTLMELAGRFDLPDLLREVETCAGDMLLTNENVLEFLSNSFTSNPRLKEMCLQFIDVQISELLEFPEFLDLPAYVMMEIVKRSTLLLTKSIDMFHIVTTWRDHHKAQNIIPATRIESDTKELLKHVILPDIPINDIVTILKPSGYFSVERIYDAIARQAAPHLYPPEDGTIQLLSPLLTVSCLMLGLNSAGKTTLLYMLKTGKVELTIPTFGFNVESIPYKRNKLVLWDLGGAYKLRTHWQLYTGNKHVLIWVVDSTTRYRFGESREELHKLLTDSADLKDALLLVLASKQDLPNAASVDEVTEGLQLVQSLPEGREWFVCGGSALSKDSFQEGWGWIIRRMREKQRSQSQSY